MEVPGESSVSNNSSDVDEDSISDGRSDSDMRTEYGKLIGGLSSNRQMLGKSETETMEVSHDGTRNLNGCDKVSSKQLPADSSEDVSHDADVSDDDKSGPSRTDKTEVKDDNDSVNETEASGYGETSGTDSSSNLPDSDVSELSRKRKRGAKSGSRLDNLVKRIMQRSSDLPKMKTTSESASKDLKSETASEENSQSSTAADKMNDADRLIQIQAFADGQMSCEESSITDESDANPGDVFVSHLHVFDGGLSSESEENKKTDKDEDYVPEIAEDLEEEEEEENKSDTGSNFSDDDFTKASKRRKKKMKKKPFLCGICNKDFVSAKMLEGHMKCHLDPKSLTCQVCGKLFDFPYKLKQHMKAHDKAYECDICGRSFSDRGGFTRHRNTHTTEKFQCDICGAELKSKDTLIKHLANHTAPQDTVKCDRCDKSFDSKDELDKHMKTHTSILYECDQCNKTFTEDEEYTAHLRAHDEEEDTFKCATCGKELSSPRELELHKKKHIAHTYVCETCGKTFTEDRLYSTHLKTHKVEEPVRWRCNKCKLEFNLKSELRDHLKTHVRQQNFKCDQCGRRFTDDVMYASHLRSHQVDTEIRWKCNKCKLEFEKKEELKEHLKLHIKPSFMCYVCSESFTYESDFNIHLKSHFSSQMKKCDYCDVQFVSQASLDAHLKTHALQSLVCETCGESFPDEAKLKRHVKFHRSVLKCKKCGQKFPTRAALDVHMKSHVQHIYVCETCGETYSDDEEYHKHLKIHIQEPEAEDDEQDDLPVVVIA